MKIFEWMQNRLNGSNGKKKPTSISANHYIMHEHCKQEFSDWPQQALLAIGTFGNNDNLKKGDSGNRTNSTTAEDSSSFQEFSLEEVGNLQNELNINLGAGQQEEENDPFNDLIHERLNSEHSSLEPEGKDETETFSDGSNINDRGNFYPSNSLIYSRGRDRCCLDSNKSGVSKKSLFSLLKKMFACSSGFPPTPLFKDPVLSTESRMEKILRAILHKKIHPQGSGSTTFINKYLENDPLPLPDDDEDDYDEEEELTAAVDKGSKWVKTDSEYIVLEI